MACTYTFRGKTYNETELSELYKDVKSFINNKEAYMKTLKENVAFENEGVLPKEEGVFEADVETYKGISVIDTPNIKAATGEPGAAQYNSEKNQILLNRELLKKKFDEKAWTKPRKQRDGSFATALPENAFSTYDDWEKFVIEHEYQHSLLSFQDFKQSGAKTVGEYEDEINRRALKEITPSTQPTTNIDYNKAVEEANTRKPIAQNFFDGYRPNSDTSKVHTIRPEITSKYGKGVKTITLVKDGIRTRSTRLTNWMKENNPKVGDYFWQINEKNPEDRVLTRITAVYGKSDSRFKGNWYKEGWVDSDFKYVENYDSAIEFEVIQLSTQPSTSVEGFQGYKNKDKNGIPFDSKGKGTPEGDGKDKAMREVADAFIGEIQPNKLNDSSSATSFKSYNIQNSDRVNTDKYNRQWHVSYNNKDVQNIIMLGRNKEFKDIPLLNRTKEFIKNAHNNGSEFVVGDMPGVDSQFIDYLQEIDAKFTIYHTGSNPRIQVSQQIQPAIKPTVSEAISPITFESAFTEAEQEIILKNFSKKHNMSVEQVLPFIKQTVAEYGQKAIDKLKECYLK